MSTTKKLRVEPATVARRRWAPWSGCLLLAVLVVAHGGVAQAKKQTVETKAAPAPVQATLAKVAGGDVPKKLEAEKEDGALVYSGKYKADGRKRSVKISAKGEVLRIQAAVAESELPEAVRKALNARYAKAEIKKCKAVHVKGAAEVTYFKIELGGKMKGTKVKLKPSGELYH